MIRRISFPLVAVLAIYFSGCATILPGNDKVVVNAERATTVGFHSIDSFLNIEHANAAVIKDKVSPEVHTYAEYLRRNAPRALRSARTLTKAYKQNRNSENKATLDTAIKVLEAMETEAGNYTTQLKQSGIQ